MDVYHSYFLLLTSSNFYLLSDLSSSNYLFYSNKNVLFSFNAVMFCSSFCSYFLSFSSDSLSSWSSYNTCCLCWLNNCYFCCYILAFYSSNNNHSCLRSFSSNSTYLVTIFCSLVMTAFNASTSSSFLPTSSHILSTSLRL